MKDNLCLEAYYLWGVLSYKMSDFKEAEIQFKKVIYIAPDIVLARINLGNIYLFQKKNDNAAREFNNAINFLEKREKNEQVKFSEGFSVELLLNTCRRNLEKIKNLV